MTDVRVQRLQECSAEDCAAEGACEPGIDLDNAQRAYRDVWEAINGFNSWLMNPWIAALTFTVERGNIDAIPLSYLIWSNVHGTWWRPNRAEYCAELSEAGRYTREEAIKRCAYGRDGFTIGRIPPELPVREIDAINRDGSIDDLVIKADRAECRAKDVVSKSKVTA